MELIKKNLTVVIAVLVASILIYAIISAQTPSYTCSLCQPTLRVGQINPGCIKC